MLQKLKKYRLPARVGLLILINLISAALVLISLQVQPALSVDALSKYGSMGEEVKAIQQALKGRGLFNEDITGYYGPVTQEAVRKFQKQKGLQVDGIAGPQTLKALGITIGAIPPATDNNVYLLARIISAEARGEPYIGQVAVGKHLFCS